MKTVENPLFNCYVSPDLCKELMDGGFRASATHRWFRYSHGINLITDAFDPDKYYKVGRQLASAASPPNLILNAYTLADCETHLPLYELSKTKHDTYELCTEKYFVQIGYVSDARLPDVFARYLLACLKQKLLDLNKLNARFHA